MTPVQEIKRWAASIHSRFPDKPWAVAVVNAAYYLRRDAMAREALAEIEGDLLGRYRPTRTRFWIKAAHVERERLAAEKFYAEFDARSRARA